MVKFQLVQEKCTLIVDYAEGDEVEVDFDLRGREWNGKYFTNLQAWKINKSGEAGGASGAGGDSSVESNNAGSESSSKQSSVTADFDDYIPYEFCSPFLYIFNNNQIFSNAFSFTGSDSDYCL